VNDKTSTLQAAELAHQLLALWPHQTGDHVLLLMDGDAVIVGSNQAVEQILGYAPQELLNRSLGIIFDAQDIARGLDRHEVDVARRVGRSEDDRWHVRKDGSRFWAVGMLTAIKDVHGTCIGLVKVLRDRTDLRAQISTMENRLLAATEAAGIRERFMRTLAHELRNPLQAAKGALVLLKRNSASAPAAAKSLEIAEKQLEVMARLIGDLSDTAQIDRGASSLDLTEVVVQSAIVSAVELHSYLAKSRGQTVSLVLPEVPIVVRADPIRLEQILRNLLDNAFNHTPSGGRVWVTATVEGPMAVVRIRDEGEGISPQTLPKIFEMFTRDQRAIESTIEGVGIGLAVVKNLVQLHQGTVEVHNSGLGYGSEFTVNLPLWNSLSGASTP
jgi:PAS domain S-box-containing protein